MKKVKKKKKNSAELINYKSLVSWNIANVGYNLI